MGEFDQETAKLFQLELAKSGIGSKGIKFISNNLRNLERPEFIPNVFQLIKLYQNTQTIRVIVPRKRMKSLDELYCKDRHYEKH